MKIKAFLMTFSLAVMLAPTPHAHAQDTKLERLDTWGSNRGWEGVGLLNIDGRSTCTGTMIRSDLVLTAAHCLYDARTGDKADPRKVEFLAGWRDGKSIARRYGKTAIVHAQYGGEDGEYLSSKNIRYDVALLQLDAPIQTTHADPFRHDKGVTTGSQVSVVSYGKGRNDAASRQRACQVLEYRGGVVAMTCDVVPGSSGSPVFAMRQGRPRIVSVVSAIGNLDGRPVSFGMDIEQPMAEIMADFQAGRGVYPETTNAARRINTANSNGNSTGARFLRP